MKIKYTAPKTSYTCDLNYMHDVIGFDGPETISALQWYFQMCKEYGRQPEAKYEAAATSDGDFFYYEIGIFSEELFSSLIGVKISEGLIMLLEYYEEKILDVLQDAYKLDLMPSAIIPNFIEASKAGSGIDDLPDIVKMMTATRPKYRP